MPDQAVDRLLREVLGNQPLTCRVCGGSAEFQLAPEITRGDGDELSVLADRPVRYEFLCGEDLGTFVSVFADPRVVTWTVTRLP
jgi:hypothetical protein